jgi:hypothetical protein
MSIEMIKSEPLKVLYLIAINGTLKLKNSEVLSRS